MPEPIDPNETPPVEGFGPLPEDDPADENPASADALSRAGSAEPAAFPVFAPPSPGPQLPPPLPEPPPAPGPVLGAERIDSMDVLRGVAVMGILVMNIQSFSMPDPAYNNPTTYGDLTGANYSVWYWSHVLAEFKFITIFSMLFGAGILVMRDRRIAGGRRAATLHYRRMFILLLIGLAHGYLVWHGDILYAYAVCGMVLYLFFWAPSWLLIGLGLAGVLAARALTDLVGVFEETLLTEEMRYTLLEQWNPEPMTIRDEIEIYQGSYAMQMEHRPFEMLRIHRGFFPYIACRVGGTILMGMGLYRMKFFDAKLPTWIYVSVLLLGGAVGLYVVTEGVRFNEAHFWAYPEAYFEGRRYNYWGSIPVALAWIALVMIVCKAQFLHLFTRPFAAVGRMAFTNYLMHTAICTTLFYGHGFGLFGELERVQQLEVVIAIWVFQLIASPIWLSMFRFGPMEWLWRSLSYMKWQPMMVEREAVEWSDPSPVLLADHDDALETADENP